MIFPRKGREIGLVGLGVDLPPVPHLGGNPSLILHLGENPPPIHHRVIVILIFVCMIIVLTLLKYHQMIITFFVIQMRSRSTRWDFVSSLLRKGRQRQTIPSMAICREYKVVGL